MKKIVVFLIISIITVTSCINVFAANYSRIVDEADLLSYDQEQELEAYIDEVSEKHKFDLVIVTVNSLNGKTSTEFADDFYDYNDYGFGKDKDGALLLIPSPQVLIAQSLSSIEINKSAPSLSLPKP